MVAAERKRGKFKSGGEEIGARHANPTQIPLVFFLLFFFFTSPLQSTIALRVTLRFTR